jgi:hypothetical protein
MPAFDELHQHNIICILDYVSVNIVPELQQESMAGGCQFSEADVGNKALLRRLAPTEGRITRALFGRFKNDPQRTAVHVFRSVVLTNPLPRITIWSPLDTIYVELAFRRAFRLLVRRFPQMNHLRVSCQADAYARLMRSCKERWIDADSQRGCDGSNQQQQQQQVHFEIFFSQLYDRVPCDHVVQKTQQMACIASAIGNERKQQQQQQWRTMYTAETAIA